MAARAGKNILTKIANWALVAFVAGRVCQLFADRVPTVVTAAAHVIPAGVFALAHGALILGRRGMLVFSLTCVGVGALAESVSRTGFPFGNYYFTDIMGPKVAGLPILLALAYLGMGYASWVVALAIEGPIGSKSSQWRLVRLSLGAAGIMLAWDLAMEPHWATSVRAWIWRDGGAYFGVPLSNFGGWYATAVVYYLLFGLYQRNRLGPLPVLTLDFRPAVLLYLGCAIGNVLIVWMPGIPDVVTDGAGVAWNAATIQRFGALASLFGMAPIAIWALVRLERARRAVP